MSRGYSNTVSSDIFYSSLLPQVKCFNTQKRGCYLCSSSLVLIIVYYYCIFIILTRALLVQNLSMQLYRCCLLSDTCRLVCARTAAYHIVVIIIEYIVTVPLMINICHVEKKIEKVLNSEKKELPQLFGNC